MFFLFFFNNHPVILSSILFIIPEKILPLTTALWTTLANLLEIELGNSFGKVISIGIAEKNEKNTERILKKNVKGILK